MSPIISVDAKILSLRVFALNEKPQPQSERSAFKVCVSGLLGHLLSASGWPMDQRRYFCVKNEGRPTMI